MKGIRIFYSVVFVRENASPFMAVLTRMCHHNDLQAHNQAQAQKWFLARDIVLFFVFL